MPLNQLRYLRSSSEPFPHPPTLLRILLLYSASSDSIPHPPHSPFVPLSFPLSVQFNGPREQPTLGLRSTAPGTSGVQQFRSRPLVPLSLYLRSHCPLYLVHPAPLCSSPCSALVTSARIGIAYLRLFTCCSSSLYKTYSCMLSIPQSDYQLRYLTPSHRSPVLSTASTCKLSVSLHLRPPTSDPTSDLRLRLALDFSTLVRILDLFRLPTSDLRSPKYLGR
jgi:hypothetical protein